MIFVMPSARTNSAAVTKRAGSSSRVLAISASKIRCGRDRRFIRYGPQHNGRFVPLAPDHLDQLLFGLSQHGGISNWTAQ